MPDMSKHALDALTDDRTVLQQARDKVEELRLWVETELDRSKLGSVADDALESLHHELEERRGTIQRTLDELGDELGAMDDGAREIRSDYYRNLGIGRSAA